MKNQSSNLIQKLLEIHWLNRPEASGRFGTAIIRYHPGGESSHLYTGFEFAYVLDEEMITN